MTRTLLPVLVLLLVPTSAYAAGDSEPDATDDPALVQAMQAWEAKGIDDYTTTVTESCFCPEIAPVRTVVRDGEIRRVTQGGRRLAHRRGHSMDRLFAMIGSAHETADGVEVTYTPRGVPKSISIDPSTMIADEERYYTVRLVRP